MSDAEARTGPGPANQAPTDETPNGIPNGPEPAGREQPGPEPDGTGPDRTGPDRTESVDPERFAELEQARLRGATRAVRGMFAGTLCLEAFTVVLVPRTVAQFGTGLTAAKLTVLLVLAGLLVVTAFVQRRRWGTWLGTALQLGVIACGVLTSAMYVLGGIFAIIWWYELRVRRELLTPRVPPTR